MNKTCNCGFEYNNMCIKFIDNSTSVNAIRCSRETLVITYCCTFYSFYNLWVNYDYMPT